MQIGIIVSHTTADGDLSNALMNPASENNTLENQFSDEVSAIKTSWTKAAYMYSILLTFAKSWPCCWSQEVMQLHIFYSTLLQK